jgi:hypothetical protein
MTRHYGKFSVFVVAAMAALTACSKDGAPPAASPPVAAAPAAAAPEVPVEGKPRVEGQGFVVEVKSPPDGAAAGTEGTAQVVLNATGGYHLNKDYPTSLELTAPDGVEITKVKMTSADAASFEEKVATWDVKFTAKAAGEKKFGAKFKFAVCTETTCDPKKEMLGWVVAVK